MKEDVTGLKAAMWLCTAFPFVAAQLSSGPEQDQEEFANVFRLGVRKQGGLMALL